MSFGYSIGDAVLLTQLAWKTVQNARKACGEHNELTQEVLSLHVVLRRLEHEIEKPETALNGVRSGGSDKEELQVIVNGCQKVLNILDQVLTKYNALGEQERSGKRLWQKITFGNGKMADMAEMRAKLTYYTSAMSLFLNMVSMGTMGRVEQQMNDTGGDLKEIKAAVNGITAHLMSSSIRHEGSVLTAYADDDRAVWKEFRRELLGDGFSSSVIRKHKRLIKAYIEELGSRGLFDEEDPNMDVEEHSCDVDSPIERATAYSTETENIVEKSEAESKVETPVESTPQPDFDIKPNIASHSETKLPDRNGPINDTIPETDSQPNPKPELRWIWLRDEKATHLFHDTCHEFYHDIIQHCIEWGLLPSGERRESDMAILLDRVSQLADDVSSLSLSKNLSSSKHNLLRQMKYIDFVMKGHQKDFPLGKWTDERSKRVGYQVQISVLFISIPPWNVTFRTGPRCRLCSPSPASPHPPFNVLDQTDYQYPFTQRPRLQ